MSSVPLWADLDLSRALPDIRSGGENATTEFKEAFSEQGHRLAKEIAALATSGGGQIFIGIDDGGNLIGVDAPSGENRDDLVERAQGIARAIRPDVKCDIRFAVEDDKTVLVISIPKQSEPVFYYDLRPYIRDGRASRAATPDEVKESVWKHPSSEHQRSLEQLDYESRLLGIERRRRIGGYY